MATKNKNIHTYDLDSVFDEYMAYLSDLYTERKEALSLEVENLTADIEIDKTILADNIATLNSIEALEKEIKKISVLTEEKRTKLEEDLEKAKNAYNEKSLKLEQLKNLDTSLFTEEQIKKQDEKILKSAEAVEKANIRVQSLTAKVDADDKKKEELNNKHEELDALIESIKDEEDTANAESTEENTSTTEINPIDDFKQSIQEFSSEIKEKETTLRTLNLELKKFSGEPTQSLETFTSFLEYNGLSTNHAEELFKYRHNPEKFEKIAYDDFKMRKMHPKRDYIIKKVVVPTAITSVAIGATVGAIAGSGLVGGAEVLGGLITVSGTPGMIEAQTTTMGAVGGLLATPIIIKGKNLITRTYYKLKAKSAVQNLDDYQNETAIENLGISKLVAKIQNTQHAIYNSRGPKNLVLKIINRNRIHQVEAYTKELFEKYQTIEADKSVDPKVKATALKPIYELLENIEEFIGNDIGEAKTHAMLTCKEDKKDCKHHTYMIENVDIYANLKIYLDRLAKIDAEQSNRKEQLKNAKKTTKNLSQKKTEAYKLVCGEKLVTGKLNFEARYGAFFPKVQPDDPKVKDPKVEPKKPDFTPKPEVAVIIVEEDENSPAVTLHLEDGKVISIPEGVDKSKIIATAKEGKSKYSITYADGTKQEIIKKAKVCPEVEAARHVLGALLHDDDFVAGLKEEGFKANTISTLKDKLTEWIKNPTQKLVLSGKVKELYEFTIEGVNAQAKEEMNLT